MNAMLIETLKVAEGFRGAPYDDHLGIPTIGYGTKLPLSAQEAELLLRARLAKFQRTLTDRAPMLTDLSQARQNALFEMAYQLGVNGCLNFRRMWAAIETDDFDTAAREMLDSRWAHQTPNRAQRLAAIMRTGAHQGSNDNATKRTRA